MITAKKLIEDLKVRKIELFRNDEKLRWQGPKDSMTAELKSQLAQLKPELMKLIECRGTNMVPLEPLSDSLHNGDCLAVLKGMPDNSVDLIATDPPYGLEFMGKDWDKAVPSVEIWKECLRVLKPGAFAFIMCAPRQDLLFRMVANLEQAGFDTSFTSLYWTFLKGMPKCHDVSKAVEKKGRKEAENVYEAFTANGNNVSDLMAAKARGLKGAYAGFQPKPAVEVILVVMKPGNQKTYTSQAMENGKAITWLDDCRIPYSEENKPAGGRRTKNFGREIVMSGGKSASKYQANPNGRVMANVLVSDGAMGRNSEYFSLDSWAHLHVDDLPPEVRETFPNLPVAKPSPKEKEIGLEGCEAKPICGRDVGQDMRNNAYKIRPKNRKNIHPTVKPVLLMKYLITLGSREGEVVLDPFLGSGTTAVAAQELNRRIVGIELNEEYFEIAKARFSSAFTKHQNDDQEKVLPERPDDYEEAGETTLKKAG